MFLDERGTGLRVTWHPERDLVVLSVWQGDRCIGTFRMLVQDVPRLSGLLATALGDWVDQAGPEVGAGAGAGAGPEPRAAGEPGPGPGVGVEPKAPGGLGVGGARLSVQQRIRLSRPVLRLRGLQHRRRRSS